VSQRSMMRNLGRCGWKHERHVHQNNKTCGALQKHRTTRHSMRELEEIELHLETLCRFYRKNKLRSLYERSAVCLLLIALNCVVVEVRR
jgi:hypothetical protein